MNDVEIKINGRSVDIDPDNTIAGTFQSADIGDLTKIRSDVTSTIELLDTPNNHDVMKNAATLGSDSAIQLGEINATALFRGIPLMSNGRAMIKGAKGGYKINIYGRNFSFIDKIKNKSLRDLDWSAFDYTTSTAHFNTNYFSNDGIIFPVVNYHTPSLGGVGFTESRFGTDYRIELQYMLPWMFLKTIVEQIVTQSGHTKTGGLFTKPEYLRSIISLSPPVDTDPLFTGVEVDVAEWMPDISQLDFIKSVLFQYGAFISTIENEVYFIQFDELYKNQGSSKDWSDKYDSSEDESIIFENGYAQNNEFKYKEVDVPGDLQYPQVTKPAAGYRENITTDETDDIIVSDNKNLSFSKTIVELPFEPSSNQGHDIAIFDTGLGNYIIGATKVFFPLIPAAEENDDEDDYVFDDYGIKILLLSEYNRRDDNGSTITWTFTFDKFGSGANVITTELIRTGYFIPWFLGGRDTALSDVTKDLSWDKLIESYWFPLENSMLKNPTTVIGMFNLTPKDIKDLKELLPNGKHGSAIPVYVKQLNGHYFVNKISRFIPDRLTPVELIRL